MQVSHSFAHVDRTSLEMALLCYQLAGSVLIRQRGYAIDDEEARMGLRCVAAVIYNDCSEPLAGISVSGMTSRITDDRLPVLGCIVRDIATELTLADKA